MPVAGALPWRGGAGGRGRGRLVRPPAPGPRVMRAPQGAPGGGLSLRRPPACPIARTLLSHRLPGIRPGPRRLPTAGTHPQTFGGFLLRGAPKTTEHRDVWWFRSGPVPKSTKRPVRALRHDPHGPCGCQIPFPAACIAEMSGSAASSHRRPRPVPYDIGHPVRKEGVPMSATLPVVSITCAAAGMFLGHRFFLRLVRPALENRGR